MSLFLLPFVNHCDWFNGRYFFIDFCSGELDHTLIHQTLYAFLQFITLVRFHLTNTTIIVQIFQEITFLVLYPFFQVVNHGVSVKPFLFLLFLWYLCCILNFCKWDYWFLSVCDALLVSVCGCCVAPLSMWWVIDF